MAENNASKKTAADKTAADKTAADKTAASRKTPPKTTQTVKKGTASATAQTQKKASGASRTVTATAASAKPGGRTPARTDTATSKKPTKKKQNNKAVEQEDPQLEAKIRRKNTFTQQFLPYILVAIALFLAVGFILNAIGDADTPSEHLMGFIGFYMCQALFGCFGWAAYLIPLLMINLVIFWKRCYQEGVLLIKVLLSVAMMLFLSAVIHVFACYDAPLADVISPAELYKAGAEFDGGGIIGGLLGYVMNLALRLAGTIVLAILVMPLLLMCLIGVTPSYVFGKLGRLIKTQWQKAADERAMREEEEDEEDEESPKESYRARRAREEREQQEKQEKESKKEKKGKASKKAVAAAQMADDDEDEDMGDAEEVALDREEAEDEGSENLVVDPRTGEIIGTEGGKGRKARQGRKKDAESDEDDEPMGLPFYESATAAEESEPEEAPVVREQKPAGKAKGMKPLHRSKHAEPVEEEDEFADFADDSDSEMDSMEIDYDDTMDDGRSHVKYEVVTASEEELKKEAARQKDPYSTVRILKSETAAVAEAGLSEEEIVISSAHANIETEAAEETEEKPHREYVFPPVDLLTKGSSRYEANEEEIAENTQILREVLESFHIRVREISCSCGPTITRFEVKPDSGVRVRSIANLVDDIAMGLAKAGVRIEAPIPGKAAVGIEVPNADPATVYFRNILETPEFRNHKSRIAACLGADVSGRPVILDINKMPHLLVAGTTGSGKSVCINSIIMSILYKAKPDEVKLILIDPKKVEFAVYRDLPHLYCPIISDPKKAAGALNSAVNEMERRFELIEEVGVRNLAGYNEITAGDPARPPMPQMVIIIDELADLMMTASNEVETAICRLAQKARAAGIHLILGTQRPSADVITGLIKANIPSRIAFTVTQAIDSRIIIDSVGAEKLVGRGDMLFSPVGTTKPLRAQGTFISDSEVERVITFIRENNEKGEFDESFTRQIEVEAAKCAAGKKKGEQMSIEDFDGLGGGQKDGEDPKFWEALEVAAGKDKIGTSALQRALNLGYGRAAKIIDRMEELGFVGPDPGTKQGRKVLITKQQYMEYRANGLPGSGGDQGDFDDL